MDEMNLNGNEIPDVEPTTDFPNLPDPADLSNSYGDSVIPDPVASPDSYGGFDIPDPVASPDSYGGIGIPDPAASPDSYGDFSIPTPEFVTESISTDSIVSPMMEQPESETENDFSVPTPEPVTETISADSIVSPMMEQPEPKADPVTESKVPPQEQTMDSQYSSHFSWNGSQYVESTPNPVPPQNSYERSGFSSRQTNTNSVPNYQQPVFTQNANGQMGLDPNLESRANTVKTLGIISLIISLLSCCGCGSISLIIAIVGIVKANGISTVAHMLSEDSKKRVKTGKTLCIVSIILHIVGFAFSFMLPFIITFLEESSMY